MKVGYLGPPASYTEQATRSAFANATHIPCSSIDAVFQAVADGTVERGVVPLENVIHGPVTETLDHLFVHAERVKIVDTHLLPIAHALGALDTQAVLKRVLSKDQALSQCSQYLHKHLPTVQCIDVASTTQAMEMIVQNKWQDAAAIGSPEALLSYGLHIIARDIGNARDNKTRFATLAHANVPVPARTGRDATAMVIYPHYDRVGILQWLLTIVSHDHGLSCTAIHSRPDTRGAFRFYLEVEGHSETPAVAQCLTTLRRELPRVDAEMHLCGTYPHHPFIERRIRSIGILGGTGAMGQWLAHFFEEAGFEVLVSGRHTPLTYQQCVEQVQVVIVNVPISVTEAVIKQVGPWLKPGQLLVDNTSIKAQPVAAMLKAVAPGVEVVGMHTIFGPKTATLRRQNVVFTPTSASGPLARELEAVFHKHGAHVTQATPDQHDRQMAFHQNLEHFSKIAFAEVLCQSKTPQDAEHFSSPNSRLSMATMGRILAGDADLVEEIQTGNTQGPALIKTYMAVTQRLGEALLQGNAKPLGDSMRASQQKLGEAFLRQQVELSKRY